MMRSSLIVEHSLITETILLQDRRITKIYIIQSVEDPLRWFGILFVDSGIYSGVVVKFTMMIPTQYPDCECPKIIFHPIPFHPLIEPNTGELDTMIAFPCWNSNRNKLYELIMYVKRIFYKPELYIKNISELLLSISSSTSNITIDNINSNTDKEDSEQQIGDDQESAHKNIQNMFINHIHTLKCINVFKNDPQYFLTKVDEFVHECSDVIHEIPPIWPESDFNVLRFSPWITEVHEPLRQVILEKKLPNRLNFCASYDRVTENVTFAPSSNE